MRDVFVALWDLITEAFGEILWWSVILGVGVSAILGIAIAKEAKNCEPHSVIAMLDFPYRIACEIFLERW